ncbi:MULTISPECIES: non-heme iron oxygenase ferredoxin subunit [unclassified Frondihabitans]|uniref:non-heme iron oxygenase ferredoxin subunit n=1 Tax=unclassified Frondihabitans TaxID=2626248 RepID=UPI000F4F9BD7|nr:MULTISPECIES: non-heme iron oxygenase ferredoxin subunit [unclassified Frondihabitans]MBF4577453.1 non-heme iron oxygenase ferredoxin subunit [Frondihabitans sp. VKM Ac-2883]RPE75034.1 3-phenylpropionate/trans-cinnamate dioxygenase ferredoxin subunit [Frondihabitans sp. PhB153]RPF04278.1 3-phenylpropionate/trans-cinnamate dioxygenase ferredoxin subunit [Frondihabitans sp. PhB161]
MATTPVGQRVCAEADVSVSEALRVVVDGIPVAVVRDSAGQLHALGDTCTHGDISLSEGFVEDDTLECWAHGSKFELTTGKPLTLPAYEPVPVFPVTVVDGDVWIDTTPVTAPPVA